MWQQQRKLFAERKFSFNNVRGVQYPGETRSLALTVPYIIAWIEGKSFYISSDLQKIAFHSFRCLPFSNVSSQKPMPPICMHSSCWVFQD